MSVGLRCAGRTLQPGRRGSASELMSGRRWSPAPRRCVTRSRGEVRSRGRAVSVFARQRRGWSRGAPFRALTRRKETLLTLRPLDMHMQPIGERSASARPRKDQGVIATGLMAARWPKFACSVGGDIKNAARCRHGAWTAKGISATGRLRARNAIAANGVSIRFSVSGLVVCSAKRAFETLLGSHSKPSRAASRAQVEGSPDQ